MLNIVSPAESHRLTTLSAVRTELQITSRADDEYLLGLIDQASDAVRTWCNRTFAVEAVRETLYPSSSARSLMLARWPIVGVSAVTINGTPEDPANVEAEDSGHLYRLDGDGRRASWPSGRVVIDYTAGYELPGRPARTLPSDIERAALSLVKGNWFARNRDPMIRSESVEGAGSTDYFSGTVSRLPPDVESLLSPYRSVNVG